MPTHTPPHHSGAEPGAILGPASSSWRIEREHSAARFDARTLWGRVPVSGELGPTSGELTWHGTDGRGRLTIATGELSSGIGLRDHHLRSGAFFDAKRNPEITFEAHDVLIEQGVVRLTGEILVRGQRRDFTCTATLERIGEERIALETRADFNLDELGMSRGLLHMIPAQVTASVRVLLVRSAA